MAGKRRKLSDLYVTKSDVIEFVDGTEAIKVVLVKSNDIENAEAVRKANAARAEVIIGRDRPDSEQYRSMYTEVERATNGFDSEMLVGYLLIKEMAKKSESIDAEQRTKDRWKDGQLEGLIDSWQDELKERYAEDPEDERAKAVFAELQAYDAEVAPLLEAERAEIAEDLAQYPQDILIEKVVKAWFESAGQTAWWGEFSEHRTYLATRWADDVHARHFDSRAEWDSAAEQVRARLMDAFLEMEVDDMAGKDLPATQGSSPPSEPSDEAETSPSSGPEVVTASKTSQPS